MKHRCSIPTLPVNAFPSAAIALCETELNTVEVINSNKVKTFAVRGLF